MIYGMNIQQPFARIIHDCNMRLSELLKEELV